MFTSTFLRATCQPGMFTRFTTVARSTILSSARPSASRATYHTGVAVRPAARYSSRSSGRWTFPAVGVGIAAALPLAMGASVFSRPQVFCDTRPASPQPVDLPPPPPPASSVNVYELSFGTVCGICAGVFVKKGAKILAFVLGGIFVLLQYFNSLSLISINWDQASGRFDNLFSTTDADGKKHPPTLTSLWNWLVNFLLADFQQRASFLAGLALGLRLG